jgi:hypothetical protein
MSLPPPEENLPDELIASYRRASAADGQRPGQRVRESILAQAARLAHARGSATEHAVASGTPAATDSRWKWKAAAGIAALGLTGLLAVQTFRTVPHGPTSAGVASTTEQAQPVAEPSSGASTSAAVSAPRSAAVPAPAAKRLPHDQFSRSLSNATGNHPRNATTAPMDAAAEPGEVAADKVAPPAPSPEARVQPPISALAMRAAAAAPHSSRDQAVAAVRANFPELFTGSSMTGTVRIAMVLNSDGTVYRTVREEPVVSGQMDASAQLSRALGIGADELDRPAEMLTLNSTPDQPTTIVVAFGIRRHILGTSSGAP